jgi:hypothetical protein
MMMMNYVFISLQMNGLDILVFIDELKAHILKKKLS